MADASTSKPIAPTLPVDLVHTPSSGVLDDLEWSGIDLRGDLVGVTAERLEIFESRLTGVRLSGAQLDHLRLTDVIVEDCELSGVILADASLTRVEFRDCRMLALQLAGARLRDVRFIRCMLDDASFRMATGERVQFDDSRLVAADFYEAKIRSTRFFDCDLTSSEFSRSELPGALLQGSTLEGLQEAAYLREVRIDSSQILPFALRLFGALGISVDDDRGTPNQN